MTIQPQLRPVYSVVEGSEISADVYIPQALANVEGGRSKYPLGNNDDRLKRVLVNEPQLSTFMAVHLCLVLQVW